jgi:hypothetical protein
MATPHRGQTVKRTLDTTTAEKSLHGKLARSDSDRDASDAKERVAAPHALEVAAPSMPEFSTPLRPSRSQSVASEPGRSEITAIAAYQPEAAAQPDPEDAEPAVEGETLAYALWLLQRPKNNTAASRRLAEYVCAMLETGDGSSGTFSPRGRELEYAERLLDYFKNARVLAPTDSKLASIEQKLDSILPYVTSKLYELEEVAEPEDPELVKIGDFVVQQVREPYRSTGHIDLDDPAMVDKVWGMVQTFRYYSVPRENR